MYVTVDQIVRLLVERFRMTLAQAGDVDQFLAHWNDLCAHIDPPCTDLEAFFCDAFEDMCMDEATREALTERMDQTDFDNPEAVCALVMYGGWVLSKRPMDRKTQARLVDPDVMWGLIQHFKDMLFSHTELPLTERERFGIDSDFFAVNVVHQDGKSTSHPTPDELELLQVTFERLSEPAKEVFRAWYHKQEVVDYQQCLHALNALLSTPATNTSQQLN